MEKRIEKNIFVWVFCFLLGGLGVDRFVRGQVGLGILKIVVCVFLVEMDLPFGIWATVDWIIAMVKAYGSAFKNDDCVRFDEKGAYIK